MLIDNETKKIKSKFSWIQISIRLLQFDAFAAKYLKKKCADMSDLSTII